MSQTPRDAVIHEYVKVLKMPAIGREYLALARQAREGGWEYEEYLKELLERERHARYEHTVALRLKQARFPEVKTLDHLEWTALQGVSRPKVLELASCEYLTKGEDVVVVGPVGTGKTHLGIGLGVEATRRRYRVLFTRAATLVRSLIEARDERTLGRVQQRLVKVDLLIVDELGFVPFERTGGELLFNILAERHGQRSTVITSNLAFGEWVQVFGNEKLTTALLDRLGHRSHILTTKGPSYRTKRHTQEGSGKAVSE
jgi:DNA replication protein DnaC